MWKDAMAWKTPLSLPPPCAADLIAAPERQCYLLLQPCCCRWPLQFTASSLQLLCMAGFSTWFST
jgi:hypothetical protein